LLMFLAYFFCKLIIDLDTFTEVKAYTVGTNGGIIFSLLFGVVISFVVSDLHTIMRSSKSIRVLSSIFLNLLILIFLWNGVQVFLEHFQNVRSDLFMVKDSAGNYQRPGNLLVVQFIVSSLLVVLM